MKVFIAAPAARASGGPELLHQLGARFKALGVDVRMYYYWYHSCLISPVHSNYERYDLEYVTDLSLVDRKDAYLIVPESATYLLDQVENCKKIIWWLSVEFFFEKSTMEDGMALASKDIMHFVQCHYIENFIESIFRIKKERVYFLSDYLREDFVECENQDRMDVVLYNPKKGKEITEYLISQAPDIPFLPLIDLTPAEVAGYLQHAKVYIDFGNHPGKDRIPREAAFSGCCVITGMNGSAAYHADVPIPDEFKFKDGRAEAKAVIAKIWDVFEDYHGQWEKFGEYRDFIRGEKAAFDADSLVVLQKMKEWMVEEPVEEELVSVVIPTYNRIKTLPRAIKSVLDQTYRNIELIIVDDGSADGTQEYVNSLMDERIRYYRNEKNLGASASRNKGAELARGKYLAFQDSDDEWYPDKLKYQMSWLMGASDDVGMVYSGFLKTEENDVKYFPADTKNITIWSGDLMELLLYIPLAGTPTMLLRREVFQELGGFDENLGSLEDYEFSLRLARKYKMIGIKEPLMMAYESVGSVNMNAIQFLRTRCILLEKYREEYMKYNVFDKAVGAIAKAGIEANLKNEVTMMLAAAVAGQEIK